MKYTASLPSFGTNVTGQTNSRGNFDSPSGAITETRPPKGTVICGSWNYRVVPLLSSIRLHVGVRDNVICVAERAQHARDLVVACQLPYAYARELKPRILITIGSSSLTTDGITLNGLWRAGARATGA